MLHKLASALPEHPRPAHRFSSPASRAAAPGPEFPAELRRSEVSKPHSAGGPAGVPLPAAAWPPSASRSRRSPGTVGGSAAKVNPSAVGLREGGAEGGAGRRLRLRPPPRCRLRAPGKPGGGGGRGARPGSWSRERGRREGARPAPRSCRRRRSPSASSCSCGRREDSEEGRRGGGRGGRNGSCWDAAREGGGCGVR